MGVGDLPRLPASRSLCAAGFQMTVAHPMTGRDANAQFQMSGRASVPGLYSGAGFNWNSMVQMNGWRRPGMNGFGRVIRRGRGWAGLGTNGSADASSTLDPAAAQALAQMNELAASGGVQSIPADVGTGANILNPVTGQVLPGVFTAQGAPATTNQTPWYASVLSSLAKTGSNIASYQLNPLYQKSTYYQTPQGLVYASNVPASGIPGLTSTQVSSMMPILLIGGVLVVVMMMARR